MYSDIRCIYVVESKTGPKSLIPIRFGANINHCFTDVIVILYKFAELLRSICFIFIDIKSYCYSI